MSSDAVKIVGGVAPASLVYHLRQDTLQPRASHEPRSYDLAPHESVRDAASRSWTLLQGIWQKWRDAIGDAASPSTGATRENWLGPLMRELGYPSLADMRRHDDDSGYPISHLVEGLPVHLLGQGVVLDRRNKGVAGAARAPQAMMQEFLNLHEEYLWGILANGTSLRLLRDSTALAGAAYIEFDLEAIFDGELYAEWLVLFRLAHRSRFRVRSADGGPADCWMEQWRTEATDAGARALGRLETGVERALEALGSGFLAHPENAWLVHALSSGRLDARDFHTELLRLAYRMLFVFVAEDRGLLLDPSAPESARALYAEHFGTQRLRRLARLRHGGPHGDQWHAVRLVLRGLSGTDVPRAVGAGTEAAAGRTFRRDASPGLAELALAPLGGIFAHGTGRPSLPEAPDADEVLYGAELSNSALLTAVRSLGWITDASGRLQPIDYRHLGAEELGSVYESLLELHPEIDIDARTFTVARVAGSERKTSGTFYTPPALVSALLDSSLTPLIDRAAPVGVDPEDGERALLSLTVCDPACGSGGFLVAAARRIAQRLAQVRAGEDQATPDEVQHAMRDVVGRCIYGVDINPLACDVAKLSLWLETLEPGRPLAFLDARIRVGNALMGVTPALLDAGVPDAAFAALDGDDKAVAKELVKKNKSVAKDQLSLTPSADVDVTALAREREPLRASTRTIDGVVAQERAWEALQHSPVRRHALDQADAWCAAFVWPMTREVGVSAPTSAVVRELASGDGYGPTRELVRALAAEYRFFHWHLEFPEVFMTGGELGDSGWAGGFSLMIGNPPWERVKLQEQEFFASRDPKIAAAPNAATRKRLIKALEVDDPHLFAAFGAALRRANGVSAFLRTSGRYPLNGRGDVNTYAVFTELFRDLIAPDGRAGIIAPTGIATDATTQHFFRDLVEKKSIVSLYDFENSRPLFAGVHRSFKFCLLALSGRRSQMQAPTFAFFVHEASEIESKKFTMTPEEITLLNPNTGTCPIFRSRRDAEITLGIYRRVPVLIREGDPDGNPWGISFMRMFDMSNDSHLFHTAEELLDDGWELVGNVFEKNMSPPPCSQKALPLYEAKMMHLYDTRWATYLDDGSTRLMTGEEKTRHEAPMPRYWVLESDIEKKMAGKWNKPWFLGWRDVARSTDERTLIFTKLPVVGYGHKVLLAMPSTSPDLLQATMSSFVVDFVARQKLGGTSMGYFITNQLPVPAPGVLPDGLAFDRPVASWLGVRVDRLNAWVEDELERAELRAEVDAYCFHLYGLTRDDVDYVMETFPIVKRKDEEATGEYRTKRLILTAYDAMSHAIATGARYTNLFDRTEVTA